ncbi:glycerophosphodiester phosphodiesterase family protein [Breoghania sp.]|uniref:glycerophosphodiester phosphodiesterase family protein n=1 Tax=Breoghania sp. TaxID=2065378 RepID=UPI00261BED11|nr:glycerophosphodiester phosphodiesterase family protein [Breoghania sp.]MDJ0929890.1 glycerophosphodiester phosphodiesterase family protein [Breoghania sp.]
MSAPDWLTARPIAHRGLHDASAGRIENSPNAVAAALERGFAIEVDLQETADQGAVVFHNDNLDRLTRETGPVRTRTLAELVTIPSSRRQGQALGSGCPRRRSRAAHHRVEVAQRPQRPTCLRRRCRRKARLL